MTDLLFVGPFIQPAASFIDVIVPEVDDMARLIADGREDGEAVK